MVYAKPEMKAGDYGERVRIYTDSNTLNIIDDNQKITTLAFKGADLQFLEIQIAVIDNVWIVYFQDSDQLWNASFVHNCVNVMSLLV